MQHRRPARHNRDLSLPLPDLSHHLLPKPHISTNSNAHPQLRTLRGRARHNRHAPRPILRDCRQPLPLAAERGIGELHHLLHKPVLLQRTPQHRSRNPGTRAHPFRWSAKRNEHALHHPRTPRASRLHTRRHLATQYEHRFFLYPPAGTRNVAPARHHAGDKRRACSPPPQNPNLKTKSHNVYLFLKHRFLNLLPDRLCRIPSCHLCD